MQGDALPRAENEPDSPFSPDVLDETGGEPLANSGFEAEDPEPDFDERS